MKLIFATIALAGLALAQQPKAAPTAPEAPAAVAGFDEPDAHRTHEELRRLLERYPPTLRSALAIDHSLLGNQTYLAPYPALTAFLNAHPEIVRNPSYFVGDNFNYRYPRDHASQTVDLLNTILGGLAGFLGFAMGIGLVVWLIRTFIDQRRWNRLAKVQAEVHSKLLDRFTSNAEMLAYMQTPAGAKFLESAPIRVDSGPRPVGAPLSRILWALQGGIVLVAAGVGLMVVSGQVPDDASQPLHALGVIGIALGAGFVISAIISFVISQRLGLIEVDALRRRPDSGAASQD